MNRTKSSDQQSTTNPTIPVCWSCNHMMCWTPLTESEISVKGTQTRPYTVRWIVSSNKKSQFWNTIPCWYFPIFDGSDPVQSLKFDGFSTHGTLQPLGNPGNRPSASSTFWQRPKVCNSTPPSMALPRAWQTIELGMRTESLTDDKKNGGVYHMIH